MRLIRVLPLLLLLPSVTRADDVSAVVVPVSIEAGTPGPRSAIEETALPDPVLPAGVRPRADERRLQDPILSDAEPSLDAEALLVLAQQQVAALGPLSIGTPDAGLLVNPRRMPEGPYWTVRNPVEAFGTAETIDFIIAAIEAVEARFPGSPPLIVGDISRQDGGHLNRHRSHQAGRDVDLGFYYLQGPAREFASANRRNLDLPRTWALVRALITDTDADRVFIDRGLMALLYKHALQVENEDPDWLDDVFGRGGDSRRGLIQHERGHKNHMHVRFFNRRAQEYGRIVHRVLVEEGAVPPPTVKHRVRRGETLGALAARYGTSVSAIRAANGLRSSLLRAGRRYLIPIRRVPEDSGPVVVPPRRLPPLSVATASASGGAAVPDLAEAR